MKVMILSGLYPPLGGGAERATALLASGLEELGHRVTIITVGEEDRVFQEDGTQHVVLCRRGGFPYQNMSQFGFFRRLVWHLSDFFDLKRPKQIRELITRESPELIITGNTKGLGGLLPRTIRRFPIPHMHIVHDVQLVEPSGLLAGSYTRTPLRSFWTALMKWVWQSPELIVFPSVWLRSLFLEQSFFPKSARAVVPNPIDEQRQQPSILDRTPTDDDTLRLLYVGQLEPHKGVRELVGIVKRNPQIALDIVGDGSLFEELKALENDRLRIHGRAEHEELDQFYGNADALVFPSRVQENAPMVILEAIMQRVPVIATPVGGVPELVIPGETGWLAAPGTPEFDAAIDAVKKERTSPSLKWKRLPELLTPRVYTERILDHLK